MKTALIFQGGWQGHDPGPVSERFAKVLRENGYDVTVTDTLDTLRDAEYLKTLDLIVPCWTMGEIPSDCCKNVCAAVENGTGIAGCHGGMCDAFRNNTDWQYMTGGQWVSHPGGDGMEYTVKITDRENEIVNGIEDFLVRSEQYYMHVDPVVDVLAVTAFTVKNAFGKNDKIVDMPVVWTKMWGFGRVFYCSLGHSNALFDDVPEALLIMKRGMLWAGEGKTISDNFKK